MILAEHAQFGPAADERTAQRGAAAGQVPEARSFAGCPGCGSALGLGWLVLVVTAAGASERAGSGRAAGTRPAPASSSDAAGSGAGVPGGLDSRPAAEADGAARLRSAG